MDRRQDSEFANLAGELVLAPILMAGIDWFKFLKHHDMPVEELRLAEVKHRRSMEDPSPFLDDGRQREKALAHTSGSGGVDLDDEDLADAKA